MENWKKKPDRDDEVYSRFVAHAHSFLAGMKRERRRPDPVHNHLDRLFRELLSAAADENRAPDEMTGYQRVAMEPLVFARLAGFIAAHAPLGEDPLRRLIEGLMLGYSEGEIALPITTTITIMIRFTIMVMAIPTDR